MKELELHQTLTMNHIFMELSNSMIEEMKRFNLGALAVAITLNDDAKPGFEELTKLHNESMFHSLTMLKCAHAVIENEFGSEPSEEDRPKITAKVNELLEKIETMRNESMTEANKQVASMTDDDKLDVAKNFIKTL